MRTVSQSVPVVSSTVVIAALGLSLLTGPSDARAEASFFVFGSGNALQTERSDDDILDPREIVEWEAGWQLGVGLSLYSANVQKIDGKPKWETRLRFGYMQGNLADVRYEFIRDRAPIYDWFSVESTDITGINLGATVHARLHPSVGVFVGPNLERIKLQADYRRTWNGTVPDYYNGTIYGGDRVADAEGSAIYGSLEVGTRIEPSISPVALEVFWIPRRVRMSTTQTVDDDQYKADFADLDATWGFRATYDF